MKTLILSMLFTVSAFAQLNDLTGLKICIDPGHGGNNAANDRRVEPDSGNVFWESESNFQKGLLLRPLLQARGATVFITRETNTYPTDAEPTLTQRWQYANSNNVHWFHSIHSNALGATNTGTNTTLVLLKENIATRLPAFPASVQMSSLIYNNIRAKDRTGTTGGNIAGYPGVYSDYSFYGGTSGGFNLGVLSGLTMPGELSEGSFHDYYPETRRLLNNSYREGEAYGIYNGFVEYYKIPYDTLGIICGTQKNGTVPLNNIVVRLLPVNKVYNGDTFNNGYFLFDSLAPGNYKVVFETPGYPKDTVGVTLSATGRIGTIQPAENATAVPKTTPVVFTFKRAMDTTMVRSVLSVTPSVTGTIGWNAANTVMSFTPKPAWAMKTTYTVALAGLGNTLQPTVFVDNKTVTTNVAAKPLAVTFTTESLPPYIQQTQPIANDTNFAVTQVIGIRFSETMDTASVRAAFQIVPNVAGSFTWSSTGILNSTLLWKPLSGTLAFETNYTVTIAGTAKSAAGMALDGNKDTVTGDAYTLSFRTARNPNSVADDGRTPIRWFLQQNYPNPFNPFTVIRFDLAERGPASLFVYDMLGRRVAALAEGMMDAGSYSVEWDGSARASGMYVYELRTPAFRAVRRMLLVR